MTPNSTSAMKGTTGAPDTPAAPSGLRFQPYLRLLFLTAVLLYLLPFALVRMPGFDRWGESFDDRAIDYGFQTAGQNADIVIFGDSSALYGVDPRLLSATLGLHVLNLPNTLGSLPVTGTMVLDHYLEHNRPPRLIVVYLTRWDLDFRRPNQYRFEGDEMVARYGSAARLRRFWRTNTADALRFPLRYYATEPRGVLNQLRQPGNRNAELRDSGGHSVAVGPPTPADCALTSQQMAPQNGADARALLRNYGTPQTAMLFVFAPLPDCGNLSQLPPPPASPAVVPAHVLPPADFRYDLAFCHPLGPAVPLVTDILAGEIRTALAASTPPRQTRP